MASILWQLHYRFIGEVGTLSALLFDKQILLFSRRTAEVTGSLSAQQYYAKRQWKNPPINASEYGGEEGGTFAERQILKMKLAVMLWTASEARGSCIPQNRWCLLVAGGS